MNKYKTILILLLFAASINVFGQNKTSYPFEVQKTGKGKKAIIFIPGFSCSGDVWNETKSEFEQQYTCYTLTMAGFAGVQPQENATFVNWENRIADFIKENKIEKPIIVGHSMGGGLALALAADYHDLVDRIIVVDALPCLPAMMNPAFSSKQNNDCSAIVSQMTSMDDNQFLQMQKTSIARLIADPSKQQMAVDWSIKSDRKTFAEMYCDFSNTDLREKIKSIKCPSLILLEAYFVNLKPSIEEQYKGLKTADLQYADKGLHFIMFDDKEWYLSQLKKFIPIQ